MPYQCIHLLCRANTVCKPVIGIKLKHHSKLHSTLWVYTQDIVNASIIIVNAHCETV